MFIWSVCVIVLLASIEGKNMPYITEYAISCREKINESTLDGLKVMETTLMELIEYHEQSMRRLDISPPKNWREENDVIAYRYAKECFDDMKRDVEQASSVLSSISRKMDNLKAEKIEEEPARPRM